MKNKKIVFIIAAFVVLLIGAVCFFLFGKDKNTIITLDINPSFRIIIDNNEKVIGVDALNEDAHSITDRGVQGETLKDVLSFLVDGVIEKNFIEGNQVEILLYSEGNIDNEVLKNDVIQQFKDRKVDAHVIVIEKITKDDEKLAKEYGISPSKAAYINSIVKEDSGYTVENLINQSINSIQESVESGKYCDPGYELKGDWCYKEISRTPASRGDVCPGGSKEYNGKCYKNLEFTNEVEYFCSDDEEIRGNQCYHKQETTPRYDEYKCDVGTKISCAKMNGEAEKPGDNCFKCVDESRAEKPTYICVVKKNGICYGGASKPYYEGKCINGDIEYNGRCYEKRQYEYVCKNGKIVKSADSYCPGDPAITDAIPVYYCDGENNTLVGDKCVIESFRPASEKKVCPSGTINVNDGACIDLSKEVSKTDGFVCKDEKAVLINNQCVLYEQVEAKQK